METKPYSLYVNGTEAELLIYGDIGDDWFLEESVSAKNVIDQLAEARGANLVVRINSFGGSVADGLAIYNAIKRHNGPKSVTIDGVAASIASLIMLAGDTVEAAENAMIMVHAPWGVSVGNAVDHRESAAVLDKFGEAMATVYKHRVDSALVDAWFTDGQDHWMTGSEAAKVNLIDKTTDPVSHMEATVAGAMRLFNQQQAKLAKQDHKQQPAPQKQGAPALNVQRAKLARLKLAALGRKPLRK